MAKRTWTQEELDYLKQEIERDPDSVDEVAKALTRTRHAIVNKLAEIGAFPSGWYKTCLIVKIGIPRINYLKRSSLRPRSPTARCRR
jgi:hypothetical protein